MNRASLHRSRRRWVLRVALSIVAIVVVLAAIDAALLIRVRTYTGTLDSLATVPGFGDTLAALKTLGPCTFRFQRGWRYRILYVVGTTTVEDLHTFAAHYSREIGPQNKLTERLRHRVEEIALKGDIDSIMGRVAWDQEDLFIPLYIEGPGHIVELFFDTETGVFLAHLVT